MEADMPYPCFFRVLMLRCWVLRPPERRLQVVVIHVFPITSSQLTRSINHPPSITLRATSSQHHLEQLLRLSSKARSTLRQRILMQTGVISSTRQIPGLDVFLHTRAQAA